MDARLAAKAERARRTARTPPARASSRVSRCTMSNGARTPGRGRVGDDLRARVEDLEPVRARLEAELGDRGRPPRAGGRRRAGARPSRRRAGAPAAVSTIAITGGPSAPRAATASGVAFGSTSASSSSSAAAARSSSNHGVPAPLTRTIGGRSRSTSLARLLLALRRDRVLQVGDDGVGLGGERLGQLRSSEAGAKRSERRWERSPAVARLYVRHSDPVKRVAS